MSVNEIVISSPADFHVHLREGPMSELVTPHVPLGGIHTAYVMPNLVPPITTVAHSLAYTAHLQSLSPATHFLSTLYLHPSITPEVIKEASKAGIKGVKSYPKGVTTNSGSGIEDYGVFYDVFREMESCGMVLNLHGEVPSSDVDNISVLNAEKHFLKHLIKLAHDFPKLRIVLEHATTKEAVECVKSLPSNVACTITPHHLSLTIDSVPSQPFHFCKPIAKEPADRAALRSVISEGHPRFFLGSDSAPHPVHSKIPHLPTNFTKGHEGAGEGDEGPSGCAAGVYTSPILVPLVAHLLESFGALDKLEGFVSRFGRDFYGEPAEKGKEVKLRRVVKDSEGKVPGWYRKGDSDVVPFMAGQQLNWEIVE